MIMGKKGKKEKKRRLKFTRVRSVCVFREKAAKKKREKKSMSYGKRLVSSNNYET